MGLPYTCRRLATISSCTPELIQTNLSKSRRPRTCCGFATFLEADCDFGKIVVHGHSVTELPDVRDNRIGIDTGACYTNALTCLVLQDNRFGFLSTRDL